MMKTFVRLLILAGCGVPAVSSQAQYKATAHRKPVAGEVPVSKPGVYATPNAKYILVNDITSDKTTLFLGKDVTLDLNGYTVKFVDGKYEHIPNSGFEEGTTGWDLSKAPGAKVVNTADVHVFLGKKLMSLQPGDEIVSSYINLPVANRSYFAMCGITGRYYHDPAMNGDMSKDMKVSVYVEDGEGNNVTCMTPYGDTTMAGCPAERKSPRLGGGFVTAHLNRMPAGKYRVRIKAVTDCLVDEIDIRPAMEAGIAIIEKTVPLASYDHLIRESYPPVFPAFYDYTEDFATGKPLSSLPVISGPGTVTIKNGIVENGFEGIETWGIQSTSYTVKVNLENVLVKNSGISAGTADILWAGIHNCRFEASMPQLIQRHAGVCSVIIRGRKAAEVAHSEFYGGQGCLSVTGKYTLVHDNLFVNDQTVTNHYSIMGTGDSSKIYNNRFEPKEGSGIYVSRYTEVYNNIFKIKTAAPTCEYGREEYSVAAVRLGDYHAAPGSPKASIGSRIHHNKIYITATNFPEPQEFIPMAYGIYYSASGGENYIYNNEITLNKAEPDSKVITAGLYICGGPRYFGGQFYDNTITSNVPAVWVASMYGGASNSNLYNNTFIKAPNTKTDFKPIRMGHMGCDDCVAKDVVFRSNKTPNSKFGIEATSQDHRYSVYWTLSVLVKDKHGKPVPNEEVTIFDKNKTAVVTQRTDAAGKLKVELPEYLVDGKEKTVKTPYAVAAGDKSVDVNLVENTTVTLKK